MLNGEVEHISLQNFSMDNSNTDVNNKDNLSEKPLIFRNKILERIDQTAASTTGKFIPL